MIFQTWKIYNLNSKLFHDLYEPCNMHVKAPKTQCCINNAKLNHNNASYTALSSNSRWCNILIFFNCLQLIG